MVPIIYWLQSCPIWQSNVYEQLPPIIVPKRMQRMPIRSSCDCTVPHCWYAMDYPPWRAHGRISILLRLNNWTRWSLGCFGLCAWEMLALPVVTWVWLDGKFNGCLVWRGLFLWDLGTYSKFSVIGLACMPCNIPILLFGCQKLTYNSLRLSHRWFWPAYGSYMAAACGLGYISFKRPACDIFIAGITQFPTTLYCLLVLGRRRWGDKNIMNDSISSPIGLVRMPYRIMFYIGFIGNAPLLPMYPVLVQYSGMSLAGINTLLHCCKYYRPSLFFFFLRTWWFILFVAVADTTSSDHTSLLTNTGLMVMWGMQGISLLHLCNAMSSYKPKVSKD